MFGKYKAYSEHFYVTLDANGLFSIVNVSSEPSCWNDFHLFIISKKHPRINLLEHQSHSIDKILTCFDTYLHDCLDSQLIECVFA